MSLVYKNIQSQNVLPKILNKKYKFDILDDIDVYVGENLPINDKHKFDINNDNKTYKNEYKRLIYSSIKHLFYKDFINGDLLEKTNYEYYPQNTLFSGSYNTNIRKINGYKELTLSSSSLYDISSSLFDSSSLYDIGDNIIYNDNIGIISIGKNTYSNNIEPNSFIFYDESFKINNEKVYLRDDGEGNIYDYKDEDNYNNIIKTGKPKSTYVGNIFYSMGLIIITDVNYLCILDISPTAKNDTYEYYNIEYINEFNVLNNDYIECGTIDSNSIELITLENSSFFTSYAEDGKIKTIISPENYFPGTYKIGYTVKNNKGRKSNIAVLTVKVKSYPLEIRNFTNNKRCIDSNRLIDLQFSIFGGVPKYYYSFDNINYNEVNSYVPISMNISTSLSNNTLFIKDSANTILLNKYNPLFDKIEYSINFTPFSYCNPKLGTINILNSNGINYQINGGITNNISSSFTLDKGINILKINDSNGCFTTSSLNYFNKEQLTYNIISSSLTCGNNGQIKINNFTNFENDIIITIISPITSSLPIVYNHNPLNEFILNNLSFGIYNIYINDNGCNYSSSVILNNYSPITIGYNVDYTSSICNTYVELYTTGGIPPYRYNIITPNAFYSSDDNRILLSEGTNGLFITASIFDVNNCKSTINIEVFEREYKYINTNCEQ